MADELHQTTLEPLLTYEQIDARDKIIARVARDQALEDAAKLVEAEPHDPSYGMSGGLMRTAQLSTCQHLAEVIRALKETS